jgi:hypothetical protein
MSYAVNITEFRVTPSCIDGRALDAFWSVEATIGSEQFTPRFSLCIGETENGPWHQVLEEFTSDTAVFGAGSRAYTHQPGRFVCLQVVDPDGNVILTSDPMDPTHGMDRSSYLEYREKLRLENLTLEKFTGVPGYLFKKRITECECSCADEILGGAFDSHCPYCYGTGKVGGYHLPLAMKADWDQSPKGRGNQTEQVPGISGVEVKRFKAMPFPTMCYKDIWADGAGDLRYEVTKSDPVLYKIYPVAQIVTVTLLPKTDPAYKLLIPIA